MVLRHKKFPELIRESLFDCIEWPLLAILLVFPILSASAQDLWPDLSQARKGPGGGERDAALVVGVENYAAVAGVPGARENAEAWQSFFVDTLKVPVDKVVLLRDNEATLEKIREYASVVASRVDSAGTLWVVFIGHGAPSRDGKDGVLVGWDAQSDPDSLYARSLRQGNLLGLISRGQQARAVVLVDACFSGRGSDGTPLTKGLQPLVLAVHSNVPSDSRTILLSAAKSDQFAGPLPRAKKMRPAFSYLALGALRGWAGDKAGRVTAGALIDFVRKALLLEKGRTQTPQLVVGAPDTVLSRGEESAPDLGRIDRAGFGYSDRSFKISEVPTVPKARPPEELDASRIGLASGDLEAMKKYDAVVRVDRSAAPAEAKARSWRQLAAAAPRYSSLARTRADDWERFAKEEGVANAAEKRRVAVRDSDWEKVSQFLLLNVVTEVDKERMVSDFLTAYWKSPGIEWAMIEAMGGHVSPNMKKRMRGLAGIEWVTVPGGEFEFGRYSHKDDEYFEDINRKYNIEAKKVRRNVSVGTFQMAKTEVTFKQYGACVLAGVCSAPHLSACWRLGGTSELPVSFRSADHPVVCVDWTQARVFSEWVGGRLPTEAEWEYAARNGGRDLKFPWGNEPESCERASTVEFSKGSNFLEESRTTCCGQEHTWPVCSRTQGNTEQGLCDMAGNVSEWVGDFDQQQDSGLHHAGRVSRGSSCGMIDLVGPGPDRPYEFHGFRPVWRLN